MSKHAGIDCHGQPCTEQHLRYPKIRLQSPGSNQELNFIRIHPLVLAGGKPMFSLIIPEIAALSDPPGRVDRPRAGGIGLLIYSSGGSVARKSGIS
jgi:hypothetical protein